MKKIFLTVAVAMISLAVSAQDLKTATETYNNAANIAQADKSAALKGFEEALKQAEACAEDPDGLRNALIENCKNGIVVYTLSIAKDYLKEKQYDLAYDQLKLSLEVATKYEDAERVAEVNDLIPKVYVTKGNQLLKDKDALGAADAYQKALELDPQNGKAALNLGQAQNMAGNMDAAEDAFRIAMGLGEEKAAAKQLSKLYQKKANAAYKAGNFNRAYDDAMTSIDFEPSPTAYKIAGNACAKLDNKKVAVECFQEYLKLSPNAKDAAQIKETINILKK